MSADVIDADIISPSEDNQVVKFSEETSVVKNEEENKDEGFGNEKDIFSQEEIKQLDNVRDIRAEMIRTLTKDGIPDNPRDIRLLNEVLTAQEGGIHSRVGSRLKKQEISNAEMAKDQIIQILKNVRTSGEFIDVDAEPVKAIREKKSVQVELVYGQTSLVEDSNIAEEFLKKYEGGE